jgi:ribosomal protein S18 acetylase RimI-like enzyme
MHAWTQLVNDQSSHDPRLNIKSMNDDDVRNFLRRLILDRRLIIAVESESIVGIATIAPDLNMLDHSGTVWNIADVWVEPSYRRRGIARSLVRVSEERALLDGATEIRLQVYATNDAASMMYGQLGYRTIIRTMRKRLGRDYHSTG